MRNLSIKKVFVIILSLALAAQFSVGVYAQAVEDDNDWQKIRAVNKISIRPKSLKIKVFQRTKLNITTDQGDTRAMDLVFSSSNDKIVKVTEDGSIIGISPGRATISIKAAKGSGKASVKVTIVAIKKDATVSPVRDAEILSEFEEIKMPVFQNVYIPEKSKAVPTEVNMIYEKLKGREEGKTYPVELPESKQDRASLYCSAIASLIKYDYQRNTEKYSEVFPDLIIFSGISDKGRSTSKKVSPEIAAVYAWIRKTYKCDSGQYEELIYNWPTGYDFMINIGDFYGLGVGIEGVTKIDDNYYWVECSADYGFLHAMGYGLGLKKYGNTWRLTVIQETWIS